MKTSSLYRKITTNQIKMAIFMIGFLLIALPTTTNAKLITVGGASDPVSIGNNLGIGTTNPGAKLDVAGQIRGSAGLNITGASSLTAGLVLSDGAGFKSIQSYDSELLALNPIENNVEIGTTTSSGAKLGIYGGAGSMVLRLASPNGQLQFFNYTDNKNYIESTNVDATASQLLYFTGYNGSNPATFSFNGNVGIGTTAPGTKLDIAGALRSSLATSLSLLGGGGNVLVMADNTGALYATSTAGFLGGGGGEVTTVSLIDASNDTDQACQTSWTNIYFNTEIVPEQGPDISHSTTVNNEQFTINTTGIYYINYSLRSNTVDNNYSLNAQVLLNGSSVVPGSTIGQNTSSAAGGNSIQNSFIAALSAGDYISLQAYKSSAGENWSANDVNFIIYRLVASSASGSGSSMWGGTLNGNIWNGDAGVGNVGIGTTTPKATLHVTGLGSGTAGNGDPVLQLIEAFDGNPWALVIANKSNTDRTHDFGIWSTDDGTAHITFTQGYTGSGFWFVPSSVSGINVNDTVETNANFAVKDKNHSSTYFQVDNTTGNVGIGNTNPQGKLVVSTYGAPQAGGVDMNTGVIIGAYGSAGLNMGAYSSYSWLQSAYTDYAATTLALALQPNGGNVGIGTTTPAQKLDVVGSIALPATTSATSGVIYKGANRFIHDFALPGTSGVNTFVGANAGNFTMTGSTGLEGSFNTAIGGSALAANTKGMGNTASGIFALAANTTGGANTASGLFSLSGTNIGGANTASGAFSLTANTTGDGNTASGYYAAAGNTTAESNVAIGFEALKINTTGSRNIAIGRGALIDLNITANNLTGYNTVIGAYTGGGIVTGVNNTIIGANVTGLAAALSNYVIIADGSGNRRIVADDAGNVGIGTTDPSSYAAKLSVIGNMYVGGTGDGLIFSADGSTSYIDTASNGLMLRTTRSSDEIQFLTNSTTRMFINGSDGNIGIGTTNPAAKLEVAGTTKLGTAGGAFTAMGTCTIAASVITTTKVNKTCTGIPASTAVAVSCTGSAAFSGISTIYCRPTGTADQLACNTIAANTTSMAFTCMWIQP